MGDKDVVVLQEGFDIEDCRPLYCPFGLVPYKGECAV